MTLEWREEEVERFHGAWFPAFFADVPGANTTEPSYYEVWEYLWARKPGVKKWTCRLMATGSIKYENIGGFDTMDEAKAAAENHYAQSQP